MSVRREKRPGKDGKTRYVWRVDVFYKHPDGRRERVRQDALIQTKRGALEHERAILKSLADGTFGKESVEVPTLKKFSDEFIDKHAHVHNKPSELAAKKRHLKHHLIPTLGKYRLNEIGSRETAHYKARKKTEGYGPKSINNQLAVLRTLLNKAVEWKVIAHFDPIKPLKVPPQDFDFLDFDEAQRVVDGADKEAFPMIVVALKTGLRIGELRALRWEDVDLKASRMLVRQSVWMNIVGSPKSNRHREIPLSNSAVRALKKHRHLKGQYIFSNDKGDMVPIGVFHRALDRTCSLAGIRKITWHVLRHTFASHLAMKGVPLKTIQELLGHSTVTMTMRYAHLSPNTKRDAVETLDEPEPEEERLSDGHIVATKKLADEK